MDQDHLSSSANSAPSTPEPSYHHKKMLHAKRTLAGSGKYSSNVPLDSPAYDACVLSAFLKIVRVMLIHVGESDACLVRGLFDILVGNAGIQLGRR